MRWFIICFILTLPAFSQSKTENLDSLISEAVRNNPHLHGTQQEVQSARSQIGQVTAWQAPLVGIEFFNIPVSSFPIPTKDVLETDYFVEQTFPWPGKLRAKGESARNNADMLEQSSVALEKQLIRDIKLEYFELYFVQNEISINKENQALMKQIVDATVKQYETGLTRQSAVVRVQTEWSNLINEMAELEKEKTVLEAGINTLVNRDTRRPVGAVEGLEPQELQWSYEPLAMLARTHRPELKAMNYTIAMYQSEIESSRKEWYPDVMVRGQYKNMSNTGKDFWSLMLGVSLPVSWWSRATVDGKISENRFGKAKSQADLANMHNVILEEVQVGIASLTASYHHYKMSKTTIIPQTTYALNLILTEYQSGAADFLTLLDAYRALLSAKLDYHMAIMNYEKSLALIEYSVGMSVAEINTALKTR